MPTELSLAAAVLTSRIPGEVVGCEELWTEESSRKRPMDETRYHLRDLVDADFPALARIWTRIDPERPTTAEEVASLFQISDDPRFVRRRRSIVEVASNEVVANGSLWQSGIVYDPKFAFAAISVDPEHQHRGLGRWLLEDLEGAARALGLEGLRATVREDEPRSVRFFGAAGFREKRRAWVSKLDLNDVPADLSPRSPDRWAADGIEFSTIQHEGPDRPEVRERLFRLYVEAMKDTPRLGSILADSREWFEGFVFRGPGYLPDAMFVARAGEAYVSFSLLFRHAAEPDTLHVSFTGTLPAYRGVGLAGELKRRSIEYARHHGYRYIETDNDSQNPRIWSINQKLGFRRFRVILVGEKDFRTSSPSLS